MITMGDVMMHFERVLVTGGTGSFGRTMVEHLMKRGIGEIRIFSRDEAKQDAMRQMYGDDRLRFYIGDVRSRDSVDHAIRGVDAVFHAAALKQVPSCEFFPMEAVQTNIVGSANVVRAAVQDGVRQVVCLSTDKAVKPVNAMGMSKGLMEKVVQAIARDVGDTDAIVSIVRYGNVMYSTGSVIPLFVRQILGGDPITMTEPSMTRFLLALSDAVELVDFAFNHARQGSIFIKKAPACTVGQLVSCLLEIFGGENEVKIIGIRHGEKMHETLATAEELCRADDLGDFYRIDADDRDLNYAKYFSEGDVEEVELDDYSSNTTYRLSDVELRKILLALPEIKDALR